jgi:hypothetical protein
MSFFHGFFGFLLIFFSGFEFFSGFLGFLSGFEFLSGFRFFFQVSDTPAGEK